MSRMDERAVLGKLAERDDIEPPAGLLEKIQGEIPAEIRVSPELAKSLGGRVEEAGMPRQQRWLIAASLVAAVGAGILGWELRGRAPSMAAGVAEEEAETVAAPREEAADVAAPLLKQAPAAEAAPAPEPVPEVSAQDQVLPAEPRQVPPSDVVTSQEMAESSAVPQRQQEELEALGYVAQPSAPALPEPAAAPMPPPPPPPPPAAAAPKEEMVLELRREAPAAPQPAADNDNEEERLPVASGGRGGSARLYGAAALRSRGTSPFLATKDHPLSTFGLDVDTGSYAVARRSLAAGRLPEPGSVRVEEWVSSFRYGDRPPSQPGFAVTAEGAPTPFVQGESHRLVRFNIRGRAISRDARVHVEWNPKMVTRYRLLGSGNREETGAGLSVTALYEIELRPEAAGGRPLATLRLRRQSPESRRGSEMEKELRLAELAPSWEAASPPLRLTAVVAELAEILNGSSPAKEGRLETVLREARRVGAQFPGDPEVAEFVDLVGRAARLKAAGEER